MLVTLSRTQTKPSLQLSAFYTDEPKAQTRERLNPL